MGKKENVLKVGKTSQPLKNCLECGGNLVYKWISHKEADKIKGEVDSSGISNFYFQVAKEKN